jgi:hypothetical protein
MVRISTAFVHGKERNHVLGHVTFSWHIHRAGEYTHAGVTHIQVLLNHERRQTTREGLDATPAIWHRIGPMKLQKLPQLLQHDHKFSTQLRFRSLRVSDMAGLSHSQSNPDKRPYTNDIYASRQG